MLKSPQKSKETNLQFVLNCQLPLIENIYLITPNDIDL